MQFKVRALDLGLVLKLIMPIIGLFTQLTPWAQVTIQFKIRVLDLGLVLKGYNVIYWFIDPHQLQLHEYHALTCESPYCYNLQCVSCTNYLVSSPGDT